jgi:hypothetical protein
MACGRRKLGEIDSYRKQSGHRGEEEIDRTRTKRSRLAWGGPSHVRREKVGPTDDVVSLKIRV